MDSLANRIKHLIKTHHGGSVNSAARVLGIPQRTLADVAGGKVKNPRADLVKRIAEFHKVTTDWLLTGEGEPPPLNPDMMHFPVEADQKWRDLLRALELPNAAWYALIGVPNRFYETVAQLPFCYYRDDEQANAKIRKARYLGYSAWITLLSSLIELWGRDVVRERLSHPALVAWFKQHHGDSIDVEVMRAMPEEWVEFARGEVAREPEAARPRRKKK